MLSENSLEKFYSDKKVFFTIVSDLDSLNTDMLCQLTAKAKKSGSYAVCEVIAMYYNERNLKALKQLRKNFNEVVEVSKLCLGDSKSLAYSEQQTCIITNFTLSLARIMFHVCSDDFGTTKEQKSTDSILFRQTA
ncbi:MAG: hypothetical protein LPK19_11720 [Hymenobacteraceae bacterium]|nr:hypothetical protein [Hymenobacteraceae bacterium]MDX5396894.1 hypothetical protein [Hymenobacteraceae bacterium]MDX5512968.1 hypothetical protein [Hymenobacteraceae bacterium]